MAAQRQQPAKKFAKPKTTPKSSSSSGAVSVKFLFEKRNFQFMGIGLGLIVLGCVLMLGGAMPDPDTWDESLIYSFRRVTLAPILILLGLSVQVYAIFTSSSEKTSSEHNQ